MFDKMNMRSILFCAPLVFTGCAFSISGLCSDVHNNEDFRPIAAYPREAFMDCIEGYVDVSFTVSEDRTPKDVEITYSTHPDIFNPPVLNIIYEWKIVEQPVGSRLTDTFVFDIGDDRCPSS